MRLEVSVRESARRSLCQSDALAEDTRRPPSAAAALRRFHRRPVSDFTPLAGDRLFGEDAAIVGGFARFRGSPVCVIGQEKGNDTEIAPQAQFRHGAAGGLSQGRAADGACRPLFAAGDFAGRYGRALFPASMRRSAARPKRSPARPISRCRSACRMWRSSSARAAQAAPSRSPPAIAC